MPFEFLRMGWHHQLRTGTKGKLKARFAGVRVRVAEGSPQRETHRSRTETLEVADQRLGRTRGFWRATPGSANQSLPQIEPVCGTPKRKLENGEQRLGPETRRPRTKTLGIRARRPGRTSLTHRNVGGSHTPGNHTAETALTGWAGRIRTWEWRNQNPSACSMISRRHLHPISVVGRVRVTNWITRTMG